MPDRADRADAVHLCLVCGLDVVHHGGGPPWGEDGASPTFDFCPCCGVEFGYQDVTVDACRTARRRWLAAGGGWREPDERPARWDRDRQLRALPDRVREETVVDPYEARTCR